MTAPIQPHSIEAEQAIIGALLINNDLADKLAGLDPAHFYDPLHARIYALAMRLIAEGRLASAVTLKTHLAEDEGLAELGGVAYLGRMVEVGADLIGHATAPHYARDLIDLSRRRDVIRLADEMQARATEDHGATVDDMLDGADRAITGLRARIGDGKLVLPWESVLESAAGWANDAYQRDGQPHISTGLKRLDEITGGLQRGRLYLLIGTSSMGKSALGIDMAAALIPQGHGVLFATFEMPGEEVAHRRVSAALARRGVILPHFDIARGRMSEDQFRAYLEASHEMRREPFLIAEDNTLEIGRLRAAIVRARKKLGGTDTPLGAIFVDYLQLIRVAGAKERVTEVGHAVREMKQWAKEFDLPVVALAQAKPDVEDRKNKRPGKRDIQWASEAHQAADAVIAVYRHEYYLAQAIEEAEEGREKSEMIVEAANAAGVVELIVSKQRGGPLGTAVVYVDLATNRFSDTRIWPPERAREDQHEFGI